jgi:hypothetical protein
VSTLLSFFGGAALAPASLLRLKALLIAAAVMVMVCMALMTWALLERSGRLSCKVETVALSAQVEVLSASIGRQNEGIDDVRQATQDARAATAAMLAAAGKLAAARQSVIDEMHGVLAKPTPLRSDGKPAGCDDAWDSIEKRGAR